MEAEKIVQAITNATHKILENQNTEDNNVSVDIVEKSIDKSLLSYEDFCKLEIQNAHKNNLPEPDFDFRDFYQRDDFIYFIRIVDDEKELLELTIRTIYPRMIVGLHSRGICYCIPYSIKDRIYTDKQQAKKAYKEV